MKPTPLFKSLVLAVCLGATGPAPDSDRSTRQNLTKR